MSVIRTLATFAFWSENIGQYKIKLLFLASYEIQISQRIHSFSYEVSYFIMSQDLAITIQLFMLHNYL